MKPTVPSPLPSSSSVSRTATDVKRHGLGFPSLGGERGRFRFGLLCRPSPVVFFPGFPYLFMHLLSKLGAQEIRGQLKVTCIATNPANCWHCFCRMSPCRGVAGFLKTIHHAQEIAAIRFLHLTSLSMCLLAPRALCLLFPDLPGRSLHIPSSFDFPWNPSPLWVLLPHSPLPPVPPELFFLAAAWELSAEGEEEEPPKQKQRQLDGQA